MMSPEDKTIARLESTIEAIRAEAVKHSEPMAYSADPKEAFYEALRAIQDIAVMAQEAA